MFELVKAYELAKNEEDKYLRFIYIKYTKWKLKHCFFKKFDIYNTRLDYSLFLEAIQIYNCISDECDIDEFIYPIINRAKDNKILIIFHQYVIKIILLNKTYFQIDIENTDNDTMYSSTINEDGINNHFFKQIFFMAIYNYCVLYVYGKNSKLYLDNKSYIKNIYDLYIY